MTNPRYRPRNCATDPSQFGRIAEIEWREVGWRDYGNLDLLAAAQIQHRIAVAVRSAIEVQYRTMKAYSRRHNQIDYEQLSTMLRGDTITRLEHIATFQRTLNLELFSSTDG